MQKNAYFQLQMRENGIFLILFPAKEGGTALNITEVMAYLEKYQYTRYDIKQLDAALKSPKEPVAVRVADFRGDSVDEQLDIDVSVDRVTATGRFYPASNNGRKLTLESAVESLKKAGLKEETINRASIESFLKEPLYCHTYEIAKGKAPGKGKEAWIEYFFSTDHNLRPKHNEDGSVDYKNLDTVSHVEAGQLLARLHKEEQGTLGMDIYGNPIKAPFMKPKHLLYANNITLSEDETEIFSDVTGHATLVKDKVFVSDVYDVPADVDNSTGNINYDGNLHIKGNIKSGFQVFAKGDIIVEGVIEAAEVKAGGQIIVKRGIHGMAKGVVESDTNIITKFIENATVKAGGYIETDLIMHSQVSANDSIRVDGKKGFITGGVIRARNLVEAQTIGSDMGAATEIEVGMAPEEKERMIAVSKSVQAKQEEMDRIKPILATFSAQLSKGAKLPADKIAYVQKLAAGFKKLQGEIAVDQEELEALKEKQKEGNAAKVVVKRDVYPGVSIAISDTKIFVKKQRSCCKFVKNKGDITAQNL